MNNYVLIPKDKLLQFIENSLRFEALADGGVDNWEWCWESNKEYLKQYADLFLDTDEDFDWQYGFEDVACKILKDYAVSSSTRSE